MERKGRLTGSRWNQSGKQPEWREQTHEAFKFPCVDSFTSCREGLSLEQWEFVFWIMGCQSDGTPHQQLVE